MANPPNAQAIRQPMDPSDVLDFRGTLTQDEASASPPPFLLTGESVASFTLALTPEAIAAGLQIKTGDGYPPPVLAGLDLVFWLAVDPAMQGSPIFAGAGVPLAIELTATTDATPPRVKQRTLTVTVANQ